MSLTDESSRGSKSLPGGVTARSAAQHLYSLCSSGSVGKSLDRHPRTPTEHACTTDLSEEVSSEDFTALSRFPALTDQGAAAGMVIFGSYFRLLPLGADNRRWDDVKNSKHRGTRQRDDGYGSDSAENYLGATVNAPVGRWQNNRDVHWYSRDVDTDANAEAERRKEEIRKLKEQEEEALSAALGFAPKRSESTGEGSGANSIQIADGDRAKERKRREKQ